MKFLKWKIVAWFLFAVLVIGLLVVARNEQEELVAQKPTVSIEVIEENAFLTEDELIGRLRRNNLVYDGQTIAQLNTSAIENFIRKMHEVETVEVYKQLGGNWNIKLKIRQPIARVFNVDGDSYYIDVKGAKMAPSSSFTARVLVFSGNIHDQLDSVMVDEIMANPELQKSSSIDDVYRIATAIEKDEFLRAQIGQVYRDKWGRFELIPLVGDHVIILGGAFTQKEVEEKLKKLKIFYRQGLPYEGWDKYSIINLSYKNQVVCTKRATNEEETVVSPQ